MHWRDQKIMFVSEQECNAAQKDLYASNQLLYFTLWNFKTLSLHILYSHVVSQSFSFFLVAKLSPLVSPEFVCLLFGGRRRGISSKQTNSVQDYSKAYLVVS